MKEGGSYNKGTALVNSIFLMVLISMGIFLKIKFKVKVELFIMMDNVMREIG